MDFGFNDLIFCRGFGCWNIGGEFLFFINLFDLKER